MIQLVSKNLTEKTQKVLEELQYKINILNEFHIRVDKANILWKNKKNTIGEESLIEVKKVLTEMCVNIKVCNYCEHNEANDIEHIYPKSFFPEYTFDWNNYLLTCKQCNSGYKLDQCHLIDNYDNLIVLKRGEKPFNSLLAFINPRVENPSNFIILDLTTFKFRILEGIKIKDYIKANSTLEILALNQRDTLIEARKNAATFIYNRLIQLIDIIDSNSKENIFRILASYDSYLDKNKSLEEYKYEIKHAYKNQIISHAHPSVWYSIKKVESKVSPKWSTIFNKIPEALDW
jgi:uncharacterized protein (TIGR02646 family)